MPINSMRQIDGPDGNRVGDAAETNYEYVAGYGDDAVWPNVVWTVIGILSVGGLVVFLLMR